MQLPTAKPVTVLPLDPLTEQTKGVVELKITGLPDAPPVAETLSVPPTMTEGTAPKEMICPSLEKVIVLDWNKLETPPTVTVVVVVLE